MTGATLGNPRAAILAGLVFGLVTLSASHAFAQGGGITAPLSGLVADSSGAVIPGAAVTVRNNATAAVYEAVTDAVGRFVIPALNPGTYTVTVSLAGFKTVALPDVQLVAATPANVRAVLELGALEETVVVTGRTETVQTQTAAVQTTIAVTEIQALPLTSRTALDYVVHLPGVGTPGSDTRSSRISGLPGETINITLDGINAQNNAWKEDGFFTLIRPQMDSVEEITVSTATPGAESTGQGAVQIRMVTRSGSDRFAGAVYNTWRNQAGVSEDDVLTRTKKRTWIWRLNTPYWFNKRDLPKTAAGEYYINDVRLVTPGFRLGGPILKERLFYFFNQEWFRYPFQVTRARYLMNETARQGIFTYPAADGSGNRTVNVLAIAAASGHVATMDLTVAKLLGDIRQAASTEGTIDPYDPNVDKYTFAPDGTDARYFPTLRLDYNVTAAHRLTFTGRFNGFDITPDWGNSLDARFPGFPNTGSQFSQRYMWQGTLRSTMGRSLVNEVRAGGQDMAGKGVYYFRENSESQFNCSGLGCQSAGGQGWALGLSAFRGITNATANTTMNANTSSLVSVEDTLTWLKGTHSVSLGASWTRVTYRGWGDTVVPVLTFGLSNLDPAYMMLDPASGNYPGGINTTWAGYARALYAVLTGRVTAVTGSAFLSPEGRYVYLGERTQASGSGNVGFFVSDAWRVRPNLTLTGGLRYEVQLPFTPDALYTRPETWQMVYGITGAGSGRIGQGNLYKPGTLAGTDPLLVPFEKGSPAYRTDWNNLAPAVGVAWRPALKRSLLTAILSTEPVIRGGYSLSYTRLGSNIFESSYASNPGRLRAATRSTTAGTPLLGADAVGAPQVFPVLLQQTHRLFPSAFPETPSYPIAPAVNEVMDTFHPDWALPHTHQYSFGFQRELGRSMAIDIRYVGNTNVGGWTWWNMTDTPQWSMLAGENGFYDEFRTAQANLRANILAGRGTTFSYTGAPGTSPLPIFLAYFQGIPLDDARNQNPAAYTAAQFRSSAWYNSLSLYNPALTTIARTGTAGLQNPAYAVNARAAGLPANFFQANPAVSQGYAYLETTAGNTRYNALQVELRRRMSQGLLVGGSYVFEFGRKDWMWRSLREDWFSVDSTRGPRQALKFHWVYELPFGRGRRFGSAAARWQDLLIGGWEVDGVGRVQSGIRLDFGNYRLVGMTEQQFADLFKIYKVEQEGKTRVYMFPQDVIENSILALYTTSATTESGYAGALPAGRYLAPASGPDCVQYLPGMCPGTRVRRIVTGPMYWKVDLGLVKRIAVARNVQVEARMDLYNIFDTINFIPTTATGSSTSAWEVTAAARDAAAQDYGGRMTQFGLRVTW